MEVYLSKYLPAKSRKWKQKKKLRNIFRINNKRHQNNFTDFIEHLHYGVIIANFEHVLHPLLVFLLLTLNR